MNDYLRRALSCALSALMLYTAAVPAAASAALGEDLTQRDTEVHRQTQLSTNVFWSSAYNDLRTENLVTYTPSSAVTPIVTYGSTLTACNTVSSAASALESQGYRVVAGMNGDFYNVNNGLPIGVVVAGGELKSSDGGYWAAGFRADGSAVIGKPQIKVTADMGYAMLDDSDFPTQVVRQLAAVNKARVSGGGIYLYTHEFNSKHTTGTTEPGVDVVCAVESGSLAMNGSPLTLRVESVLTDVSGTAVPEGKAVLSANAQAGDYFLNALKNVPIGAQITVTAAPASGDWLDVQYAVGALYALVQNGAVVSGLPSGVNPRTALGQKADGTLVFYTVDGRKPGHSVGASLTQVGERLAELGCVSAICLDGGGSTTLTATMPDAVSAAAVNRPSGGSERAVSNQVFLVASGSSSGQLDHFYVSADSSYVLAGSKVTLSAAPVDTNYIPMSGASYTLSASAGEIAGDVLTTPVSGGDVTVTASGSGCSGSTVVHAIATPDAITVKNGSTAVTTLTAAPGGTVQLTASAVYRHLALTADPEAFTWTVSDGLGTVDKTGKFTAGTPGTGTLTVSAGGRSATVSVTVSHLALAAVEDFETQAPPLASYSYGGTLTRTTDANFVKYGKAAGAMSYTIGADGTASILFAQPMAVGSAYTQLNLWLYGDNSGSVLSALTTDGTNTTETSLGALDFSGWRQLTVPLPTGTAALEGFKLMQLLREDGSVTASAGTVYLDQIVASYNGIADETPPEVTASVSGGALTAQISDAADRHPAKNGVSVTVDGKAAAFTYDESTGALTAQLTLEGTGAHRVTVTARDASGNIGRASCDIAAAGGEAQFRDTAGYWAGTYVDWLKTAGITSGFEDGTFRPDQSITRQQFAVMLYRYLGVDGTQYEDVTLPFADSDQIGEYARTAVKALYSMGVLTGSQENGKLYFHPAGSLTRAQAATMIGRTQSKGYAQAELSFADADSIPAYAAYYIRTMLAQKVVSGYEDGAFRPNRSITRGQMAKILYNLL